MTKTAMQMIGEARAQVGSVAPKEAADQVDAGAVFVDVREPEEWQHGHINGSVPAPRGLLEFFADPTSPRHKEPTRPQPPGHRRVRVRRARVPGRPDPEDDGLQDVAILDGGLKGWTEVGLPTNEHEYSGI